MVVNMGLKYARDTNGQDLEDNDGQNSKLGGGGKTVDDF